MKEWKKWTSDNHIKIKPKNENFIFYAYKWIQLAFPKATIDFVEPDNDQSLNSEDSFEFYYSRPLLSIFR